MRNAHQNTVTSSLKLRLLPALLVIMLTGWAFLTGISTRVMAAEDQVVIFTANWCASCRQVVPAVKEVAQEKGFTVMEVDVDNPGAPGRAKEYGLSVPTTDPPQVYLVTENRSHRLFDGTQYRFGTKAVVRKQILENLQTLGK